MVKPTETNQHNNEIDLLELFLNAVNTIRHNFWLITSFFLVGLALGVVYFMAATKEYESRMIISSGILTAPYANILFENVNKQLHDGGHILLAADLGMNVEAVKQINSLKIENVSKGEASSQQENERFAITARIYNNNILLPLQNGILYYLANNEFVRVRVEQNRTLYKQMLSSTEEELQDLQQFKTEIYSGKFFNNTKGNVMFDPTSVNTKILELTQRKVEYQNLLALIDNVQLIKGFTPFNRHVRPQFALSLVSGSLTGLFLVGILIAFKSIRRIVRMADAQKMNNAS